MCTFHQFGFVCLKNRFVLGLLKLTALLMIVSRQRALSGRPKRHAHAN